MRTLRLTRFSGSNVLSQQNVPLGGLIHNLMRQMHNNICKYGIRIIFA